MPRILIVASVASMIEQFTMHDISTLRELGYEIEVAANFSKGNSTSTDRIEQLKNKLTSMNIVYYNVCFSRNVLQVRENFIAFKQLDKILKYKTYNLVHCHSPVGGVIGRMAAKKNEIRTLYTAHGFHFYRNAPLINWILYYPIEKFLSKFTDVIITINTEDYAIAKKKFVSPKIYMTKGIGINLTLPVINEEKRKLMQKQYNIKPDDVVLLSVGELNSNKNHEVIIRAIKQLNVENVQYFICGKGEKENQLKNMIAKLGLEKKIHLVGFQEDIMSYYKISDIFIFPSYREGLSVALMEAMVVGLPVICSNIRGNCDLIDHSKGGILVKPSDIKGFSNAIKLLSKDKKKLHEFSEYNKEKIKIYSIKDVQNEIKEIYLNVIR